MTIDGQDVTVKGPKGELSLTVASPIEVKLEEGQVLVTRPDDERASRSLHGLTRTLINNQIIGVTEGYSKGLEVVGTGYRVAQKGSAVEFALGFSHPVTVEPPAGITLRRSRATTSSPSAASTSRPSARSPPTSARSASPSPTRARVCATPARSSAARPERLVSNHGSRNQRKEQVRSA